MGVLLVHCDHRPFEVERFGEAWVRAGGVPGELIPVTPSTWEGVVRSRALTVTGLLLTGGPDVEPWRYGRQPEAGVVLRTDPPRDALDLDLLGRAEAFGWPVLAVCYGCQVLNVFHGGTLIQDLERAGRRGHSVSEPKDHLAHAVRLPADRGRALAGLPLEFAVNSRHHQALDVVAPALRVVGACADGIVEAVEPRDASRFVLGVQWHPENIAAEPHVELFRRFRAETHPAR